MTQPGNGLLPQVPAASVFAKIDAEIESQARKGSDNIVLKAEVVKEFERAGLQAEEVYRIIGSGAKEQIVRRVREGGDLTPDQSERASRIAHIVGLAERVFKSREKAFLWLRLPNGQLGNKQPLEILVNESGARFVEEALLQMEYGIYG